MSLEVSIVICCYNSAERLPKTLAHLARQQVPAGITWEIIVVDNGSTDDTIAVARKEWPEPVPAPLRVVKEPRSGVNHARLRGADEAMLELICFVDDDNWVAPDWISRIVPIFAAHPEVGACGGRSVAVTETKPPDWFERLKGHYAVGSQYDRNGDMTDALGTLLWTAGCTFRKTAWLDILAHDFEFLCPSRRNGILSCGEDTELCYVLRALGWRIWYDDDLVLQHFMPASRLTWSYVRRLRLGGGEASVLFDLYLTSLGEAPYQDYPAWKKSWFFRLLKALWLGATAFLSNPLACLLGLEGADAVLKLQEFKGRWQTLFRLRSSYGSLSRMIAQRYGCRKNERGGAAMRPPST